MTGFGEARHQNHGWTILVEIRTINNRHFKLQAKITEAYAMLEPAVEQLVRQKVRRGTVQLNLRIDRPRRPEDYRVNLVALASYRDQLQGLRGFDQAPVDLSPLMVLPGVIDVFHAEDRVSDQDWPKIAAVVDDALARLEVVRAAEGRAMAAELIALCRGISGQLDRIADRGPDVVRNLQKRLCERVQALVHDNGVTINSDDLAREIAILADRGDFSEEIVRLRSHVAQFDELMAQAESSGRKLEFLTQEMGREINTIGSKANDVPISRAVVEVKALLERIRELVQNVE
jgi:uncharacterized protein (TIGR00255 family)